MYIMLIWAISPDIMIIPNSNNTSSKSNYTRNTFVYQDK